MSVKTTPVLSLLAVFTLAVFSSAAPANDAENLAAQIIEATGVTGGLVVHLGCGDGTLTTALHIDDSYLVHGLDTDAADVARARDYIRSRGLYGEVAVDQWDGEHLPYIENLVNLIVAESPLAVSSQEILRILAPGGIAYIRRDGAWTKTVKPRPEEMDDWTHYLHDATNNAVSHDTSIAPPRHQQWLGGPRWGRQHDHMSSTSAMTTAGGRMFTIFDEGSKPSIILPSEWWLTARDAFNGTVLWKRPIKKWYTHLWPLKSGPAQLPRRMVATEDTLYVTLAIDAPLTALDAATGETIRTYEGSKIADEVIYSDGLLFVLVSTPEATWPEKDKEYGSVQEVRQHRRDTRWNPSQTSVKAYEADTGTLVWQKQTPVAPLTLTADDDHVYLYDGENILCLDKRSGNQLWASNPLPRWDSIQSWFGPTLVAYEGVVLFAGGNNMVPHRGSEDTLFALSADSGEILWQAPHPQSGYQSPEDILVAGGLVWCGATTNGAYSGVFTGYDPKTGEAKKQFPPDVDTYWFHHRCHRAKATDRYLLTSRTGIEFIDPETEHWTINHWVRGACLYGIMPANGMIYTAPHDCACYIEAKQYGFNALAPDTATRQLPDELPAGRLQKGPAYNSEIGAEPPSADEWPTYRHDNGRSGTTPADVSPSVSTEWQVRLDGKLTSPVVAGGKLFVAAVDTHTLFALDAATGDEVWHYIAGGRIDSPPTIYKGRVLFGCADGYVYCLRASDGELVWRFRAAPMDRRMTAFQQVESAWPIHGSVLVRDGVLWCVAGRSMFLDEGLRMLKLDPVTGEKIAENVLDDTDPETGENLQRYVQGLNMTVALPDILSSDAENVYMRSIPFDEQAKRKRLAYVNVREQPGEGVHLFAPTGFVDGTWFHRSYWVYGRSMASGAGGYYQAGRVTPSGRIMSVGDSAIYGYGRRPQYYQWTTPLEYRLFSAKKHVPEFPGMPKRGSYVSVENSESLNPVEKSLTIAAWANAQNGNGIVIARGGSAHGYSLYLKNGRPWFAIRSGGDLFTIQGDNRVVGKWVHLAGVLDEDKNMKLYVDGEVVASKQIPKLIVGEPAQPTGIGSDDEGSVADNYQHHFGFKGVIDEPRIYHRALTENEIKDQVAQPDQPADDEALALYFSFDDGKATDQSGNGNDGELVQAKAAEGKVGQGIQLRGIKRTSRALPYIVEENWTKQVPIHVRAMVLAGNTLFIAGLPDLVDEDKAAKSLQDPETQKKMKAQVAAWDGEHGGKLFAVSTSDGEQIAEYSLDSPPRWDGLIAADGRLYMTTMDGSVICMEGQ